MLYGSPEHAVEAAIAESPVEHRQEARRELHSLLAKLKNDKDLRDALNQGLGVNVYFRKPHDARKFAEEIEQKMLRSIEDHFERSQQNQETEK